MLVYSECGKKIHIYSLIDYDLKYSFFRGLSEAMIVSSCFCENEKLFAIYSSSGTIHFFKLDHLDEKLKLDSLIGCTQYNEESDSYFDSSRLNMTVGEDNNEEDTSFCQTKNNTKSSNFKTFVQPGNRRINFVSQNSFKPKYNIEAKMKSHIYKNHKASFLQLKDCDSKKADEKFRSINLEKQTSVSIADDSCLMRSGIPTYKISPGPTENLFQDIFFFKTFNTIVQVKSDGIKKEYEIDFSDNKSKAETTKIFKLLTVK